MNRTQKLATLVSGVVVAGLLAIAAPVVLPMVGTASAAPRSTPEAASAPKASTPAPVAESDPPATEATSDPCTSRVKITIGDMSARVSGRPVDLGARGFAAGTVGFDDQGNIVTYTVAAGDAPSAIGDRLCVDAMLLPELNHTRHVQPGQVLRLTADPSVPSLPYYNPADAPEGFLQIPYQYALEEMGRAADVGDVDTMRAIWADRMAGMFIRQSDIDVISQALEAGDIDVLRQMFS